VYTVQEIIKRSTEYLQKQSITQPRLQAEEILADVIGLKRLDLYLNFDRPLQENELQICREHLQRRAKGEPLQYIRGQVEFLNCTIKVTPDVLIPRQETEILADKVIKSLSNIEPGTTLLDLCCGSGCLAIAIKKRFPELRVVASDLSKEALAITKQNAQDNQVEIECVQGDLFENIHESFDIILSNPPYIAEHEYDGLEREVRQFEPKQALISGPTGLEIYRSIEKAIKKYLKPKGQVWLEIGTDQGSKVLEIFDKGKWKAISLEKDWAGHDRFFFLENE
jgi:release factor glutamine methyltransferase